MPLTGYSHGTGADDQARWFRSAGPSWHDSAKIHLFSPFFGVFARNPAPTPSRHPGIRAHSGFAPPTIGTHQMDKSREAAQRRVGDRPGFAARIGMGAKAAVRRRASGARPYRGLRVKRSIGESFPPSRHRLRVKRSIGESLPPSRHGLWDRRPPGVRGSPRGVGAGDRSGFRGGDPAKGLRSGRAVGVRGFPRSRCSRGIMFASFWDEKPTI